MSSSADTQERATTTGTHAMSLPDWKQWIEASHKERQNLVDGKVFMVLSNAGVERLQHKGVEIHTVVKNVLKTMINTVGEPYKYKARVLFRVFH
jgi:hypothetical protein